MDIFKLGVRDVFGIMFPGAVLLFVIIYVFWSLSVTLGLPPPSVSFLKDQGFLLSIVFLVASYVLGYLLRLGTADQVDKESSEYLLKRWWKDWKEQKKRQDDDIAHRCHWSEDPSLKGFLRFIVKSSGEIRRCWFDNLSLREWIGKQKEKRDFEESFKQLLDGVRRGEKSFERLLHAVQSEDFEKQFRQLFQMKQEGVSDDSDPRAAFDEWLWRADSFPYLVCYLRRTAFSDLQIRRFFSSKYERCVRLMSNSPPITGTQFFNYCKLVISRGSKVFREEINVAESNTRFLVGTYSALKLSRILFSPLLALQVITAPAVYLGVVSIPDFRRIQLASLLSSTFLLILGSYAARNHIKKHFRRLRLREADTVYDAFYLVWKEKDHFIKPPRDLETPD